MSDEAVRVRPHVIVDLGSRRYSVGYSARGRPGPVSEVRRYWQEGRFNPPVSVEAVLVIGPTKTGGPVFKIGAAVWRSP